MGYKLGIKNVIQTDGNPWAKFKHPYSIFNLTNSAFRLYYKLCVIDIGDPVNFDMCFHFHSVQNIF